MTTHEFDEIPFDPKAEAAAGESAQRHERAVESAAASRGDHSNTPRNTALVNDAFAFKALGSSRYDSIYLSYYGSIKSEIKTDLEILKTKAQSNETISEAQFKVETTLFRVTGSGRNGYQYTLLGDNFEIELDRKKDSLNLPVASIKIYSIWLLSHSPEEIECEVTKILSVLCVGLARSGAIIARQAQLLI